jgi:glycogen(starch) synthase
MKILHVLDHYKPHFSGYVFRTSYILKHQRDFGIDVAVITSPKHGAATADVEDIDGMKIYRTLKTGFGDTPFLREIRLMKALQERIEDVACLEKPDIIHAHSPSLNGVASLRAARRHGIPVVYEVRAFWEDAAVDHGTFCEGSLKYRISRFVESRLFQKADALFTICGGLRDEIISRGIAADKITVVPNCVDASSFSPADYDEGIADKYGLKEKTVFGFLGSLYHYEGIDLLLDSFKKVLPGEPKTKLLLVGDGPERDALHRKAGEMGLLGHVTFTGKVPHEEVIRYYSVMNALIYPRKKMRLTDLVTPLKPLEAMAMGKVVVGSDVGGIREFISHNENGFLFKAGDSDDLALILTDLAAGRKNTIAVSKAAAETVLLRHKWESAVKYYLPVYNNVARKAR